MLVYWSIGIHWALAHTMQRARPEHVCISRAPVRCVHFWLIRQWRLKEGHPGRRPRIARQMGAPCRRHRIYPPGWQDWEGQTRRTPGNGTQPTASHQPPTNNRQPTAAGQQPATANTQQPTANSQSPAAANQWHIVEHL